VVKDHFFFAIFVFNVIARDYHKHVFVRAFDVDVVAVWLFGLRLAGLVGYGLPRFI